MDAATFVDHSYFSRDSPAALRRRGRKEPAASRGRRVRSRTVLQRVSQSPEDVQFYTGFTSLEHLLAFWSLIEPATSSLDWPEGSNSCNAAEKNQEDLDSPADLTRLDEFLLFMSYLTSGWSLTELSQHFKTHIATFTRIILTWANFLYGLLGSVRSWMTAAEVKAHLPREFMDFIDTQVVIDCIELHCEAPSPRFHGQDLCPSHQSCCTLSGVVGMAPHGAVMFVSALGGPSASPREIFRQSGIRSLLSSDMAVMADERFQIEDLVPGRVHRLPPGSDSLQNASKGQAALRVHVEDLFSTLRENKVFSGSIPPSVCGSLNQLFTVACLLCNYQRGPLGTPFKQED
ncbi:uncharacterized protein LOC115405472 [Salarias fasciatus]|uniref:Uncharacterized LOC115405472 n=1 Tax=Salarias fasciatus TaxID=181472 RepID=A0A672HYD4_SALFA|nr:uncharacterized protein LOC115405472 [Salarias fasciatus]